jgi:hypothetical protein
VALLSRLAQRALPSLCGQSHPYATSLRDGVSGHLVCRTLAISCEGRTTLPLFSMTEPTMMLPPASNRPSSAVSRC